MAIKKAQRNSMTPTRKTYQNTLGKWVVKQTKTDILICPSCGGKYIKTRDRQRVCIRCIYAPARAVRWRVRGN